VFLTPKEQNMSWQRIEGQWHQVKGRAREQWGKLTDNDVDIVVSRGDQLANKIQERYCFAKDDATQ